MNEEQAKRIVEMAIVNPGEKTGNGEFRFSMQPRYNAARTVEYAIKANEAEALHKALGSYLRAVKKEQ
jgi:hypothetical protein